MKTATALSPEVVGKLDKAVAALRWGLKEELVAVILYGSYARGQQKEWSDIDLLVIVEWLPERIVDRATYIRERVDLAEAGPVQILPKTKQLFESVFPSLYLDLGLDGVILYDRKGYAAEKLARIREITQEAGLFRVETSPGNFMWDWVKQPKGHWRVDWTGSYGVPR